ncbi:MAG: hypothetical protein K2K29_02170, partial [Muribaculaceae bacterium]|nr:hypothetical protein [Muribaculaceae bacterium]
QRNAQSAHKEATAASVHHKSGQHEVAAVCDCCHGGTGRNVTDKSALLIGEKSENEGIEMGIREWRVSIEEAIPEINWKAFLHTWRLSPKLASEVTISEWEAQKSGAMDRSEGTAGAEIVEAQRLIEDARRLLTLMQDAGGMLTARAGIVDARRAEGEDAILLGEERIRIWTPRKEGAPRLALADFVAPEDDHLGLFAVTAKEVIEAGKPLATEEFGEEYGGLLLHSLADRLVEAATEIVHRRVHTEMWGLPLPIGIRPAVGYAALPDQKMVFALDRLLNYGALGVELTENGALAPASTTTGLIFGNPAARYF